MFSSAREASQTELINSISKMVPVDRITKIGTSFRNISEAVETEVVAKVEDFLSSDGVEFSRSIQRDIQFQSAIDIVSEDIASAILSRNNYMALILLEQSARDVVSQYFHLKMDY